MGIAGFVLGLLSLVCCWVPVLGFLLGIIGIVFSAIGIVKKKNKGLSIAGLVTGIIGTVVGLCVVIALWLTPTSPMKYLNKSRHAIDVQNYDNLVTAATVAVVDEEIWKEVTTPGNEIVITMTIGGVVIKENGEEMSLNHKFIKEMQSILGQNFKYEMSVKDGSETYVITIGSDGKPEKAKEPDRDVPD